MDAKLSRAALRRRQQTKPSSSSSSAAASRPSNPTNAPMKIYQDDAPGIKVDPVVVLVASLTFIASVFVLHIIGKFMRA